MAEKAENRRKNRKVSLKWGKACQGLKSWAAVEEGREEVSEKVSLKRGKWLQGLKSRAAVEETKKETAENISLKLEKAC